MMLNIEGSPKPEARPWTALSAITIHRAPVPVTTSSAMRPCVRPDDTLDVWITRRRGRRYPDHAAPEQDEGHRDRVGGQDQAQRGRGIRDLQDREGQRNTGHRLPEEVDETGAEVPAEVWNLQGRDRLPPSHPITRPRFGQDINAAADRAAAPDRLSPQA